MMKKYLAILLVLCVTNTFAALNKWVDEKGNVHYSDQPPPANVKKTTLRFPPPPPVPSAVPATPVGNATPVSNVPATAEGDSKK